MEENKTNDHILASEIKNTQMDILIDTDQRNMISSKGPQRPA